MNIPVQFIVAFLATMSFTILFQAPMKYCVVGGVVGGLGWLFYTFIVGIGGDPAIAGFVASLVLIVLARFFAIVFKTPSTMFLLAGIFPLVPGTGIYYTAYYLFAGDMAMAGQKGMDTLITAGVIALGLLFGSAVPQKAFDVLGSKIVIKEKKLPKGKRKK
ncbi:threonine/serine exporter family protein [Christensenellaceae bacterium OttesenSCG-928-M15]|nr:threonine/serine exporter family protein [Christensenellaceae bacterium OttesenSCG-928-M15]